MENDYQYFRKMVWAEIIIMQPTLHDDFIFGEVIGSGGQATVNLCFTKDSNREFAVKSYFYMEREDIPKIYSEIQILRKLRSHSSIPMLELVYEESEHIHLVMQLIKGQSLENLVIQQGALSEEESLTVINQLLNVCHYLEKNGVIHRDIKPDNILIENRSSLKTYLVDFGIATFANDTKTINHRCGTPGYCDPIVLD